MATSFGTITMSIREADRLKTVQAALTEVPRGGCTADAAGP
jgi:hypothetical protein